MQNVGTEDSCTLLFPCSRQPVNNVTADRRGRSFQIRSYGPLEHMKDFQHILKIRILNMFLNRTSPKAGKHDDDDGMIDDGDDPAGKHYSRKVNCCNDPWELDDLSDLTNIIY